MMRNRLAPTVPVGPFFPRSKVSYARAILAVVMFAPCAWWCGCASREAGSFEIAVVTDAGGLGDKGKNDMVWRGCQRFAEESSESAEISSCEPATEEEGRAYLKEASAGGADVVVVASAVWEDDVLELARAHPDVIYLVVGGGRGAPNVGALSFPVRDAGYLMGVAAAAAVPAGSYAFLGGRKDAHTENLAAGYEAGIRSENPTAEVATAYVGTGFDAPAACGKARRLARRLFDGGAAVIFAAAGLANADVAAVAKEKEKLIIGYESNQNYLERGYVVTSLNLRWDEVIFEELAAAAAGTFAGGEREMDLASERISYPIDDNNRSLIPAEAIRKIEAARQRLAAGAAG
jgi:basic membrane protein A